MLKLDGSRAMTGNLKIQDILLKRYSAYWLHLKNLADDAYISMRCGSCMLAHFQTTAGESTFKTYGSTSAKVTFQSYVGSPPQKRLVCYCYY